MPKLSWRESIIYKELLTRKGDHAKDVITLLERPEVMDKVETILDKGHTIPKDFTLHDADHSFRVADKMWELIPEDTKTALSDFEMGLLLLSAFLHDIGMSPDFDKVERHEAYLISDKKNSLSDDEINEFQEWIDNDSKTQSIDIKNEIVNDKKLINYILSYYVRQKHNEWSGEWIIQNFDKIILKGYKDWSHDLILICKSHHYGIDHLILDIFDPKPVTNNMIVHVRYLAMCLRVADVMENDPERTPEVILKHRLINESSVKFWLKDNQYTLTRTNNKFNIYARPERAYLHKAIEETAQWIEDELRLCEELSRVKPLSYSSFANLHSYTWDIEAFLTKNIQAKDNRYVYIQGAFKPNTAKILELLGGNQIYGDSIWAYRELIQNSFDAVKERVAYQIINEDKNPSEFQLKFGNIYSIQITLEKRSDGVWLICKDQGVGMTKKIIEKFFLESGSSKRHEISELERRCKSRGFNFGRTGQFGIGVLSYFMIAEKVVVKTKRELNTGYSDNDSKSWHFEINGTHDFGELRELNKPISGTQIELKLKTEIEENISEWNESFKSFIKNIIKFSPCECTYCSYLETHHHAINYGWSNTTNDVKNEIIKLLEKDIFPTKNNGEILSLKQKQERFIKEGLATDVLTEASNIIDFFFEEGEIKGVGRYRIHVPFFKLTNGYSFCYLKETLNDNILFLTEVSKGHFWKPRFTEVDLSLKGIKVNTGTDDFGIFRRNIPTVSIAKIEIDLESINPENLSVSRHNLILDDEYFKIKSLIDEKVKSIIRKNKSNFNNIYGSFNKSFVEFTLESPYLPYINSLGNIGNIVWKPAKFPCAYSKITSYDAVTYLGKPIEFVSRLSSFSDNGTLDWFDNIETNYIIGVYDSINSIRPFSLEGNNFFIIENAAVNSQKKIDKIFNLIDMPEQWINVIFINPNRMSQNPLLNKNFSLFKYFDPKLYMQILDRDGNIQQDELNDKSICFAYLLYSILFYTKEKWVAWCETNEMTMNHVFKTLDLLSINIIEDYNLVKVSFAQWENIFSIEKTKLITPSPTDNKYLISKKPVATNSPKKKFPRTPKTLPPT